MKKVYLSLLAALGTSALSYGQYAPKFSAVNQHVSTHAFKPAPTNQIKALGQTIWTNDFSNASDWTMDNDGQTGTTKGWQIGTTTQSWYFTTNTINSNSGGNFATVNNGTTTTPSVGVEYTMTTTDSIDISGAGTALTLSFYQYGAHFNDDQYVSISTDGTTFTRVYDNTGIEALTQTGGDTYDNPMLVTVNLTQYLTGATKVYVRFGWTSEFPTSTNPNAWVTYGWMVDDVSLATNPDFDLEVTGQYWGTAGLSYYQIPKSQVQPIDFYVVADNGGSQSMTNSQLNVVALNGGTSVFNGTSTPIDIPSLSSDTLALSTSFTPNNTTTGVYQVARFLTSDSIDDLPGNNILDTLSIAVTDYIYARDNGLSTGGYGSGTGGTSGFEAGNLFDIYQDVELKAINVKLSTSTPDGTDIYVRLYVYNDVTGDFDYVEQGSQQTFSGSTMIGSEYVFLLDNFVTLTAGNTYLAVVGSYNPDLVVTANATTAPQTSFYYDYSDNTWYYVTSAPYVRLNFNPVLAVNDVNSNVSISNVYPNPTTGKATISYSLENAADEMIINVVDVAGRIVYTTTQNNIEAGSHALNIDAASFNSGIYYVNMTSAGSTVTQKFVKK